MKKSGARQELIKEADPDVVEELKWMGTPVWSAFKALVRQAIAFNSSGKSKPSKKAKF